MKLREHYGAFLGGRAFRGDTALEVRDKYTGEVATRVALADRATVERAIGLAHDAAAAMARLAGYERKEALVHCVARFRERAEELAWILAIEVGKPIKDARGEVGRLIDTFELAAEESVRLAGEILPLDRTARGRGYTGYLKRVPLGPIAGITPFNFPLNLGAHKVAPSIAAGCPFVWKPASATPVSALVVGEILAETGLPAGAFSVLPCRAADAEPLIVDERVKLVSFTGSPEVGWELKRKAGKKRVSLELGGNAACIVCADADLDDAVERLVFGAFYQSGQSCVSVQRILVEAPVYDALKSKLVARAKALVSGDPKDERTFVGPLITEADAARLEAWIASATKRGAKLLCGGTRRGAVLDATLLEGVPRDEPLCAAEAFGPIAVLEPFASFDDALRAANDSRFGLQAGVFTRDLERAQRAWDELEVGGVIVNDVPSWRADAMPYGGVKDSGFGREGVRWSIEELTEPRLMVVRRRDPR
ncbi:MAG: aldehyde dehydrogenase family protein [Planctomycetes bacterium]|nr:aldehyde dehydrogenase family protein [Planctomycetota bacterium]